MSIVYIFEPTNKPVTIMSQGKTSRCPQPTYRNYHFLQLFLNPCRKIRKSRSCSVVRCKFAVIKSVFHTYWSMIRDPPRRVLLSLEQFFHRTTELVELYSKHDETKLRVSCVTNCVRDMDMSILSLCIYLFLWTLV